MLRMLPREKRSFKEEVLLTVRLVKELKLIQEALFIITVTLIHRILRLTTIRM